MFEYLKDTELDLSDYTKQNNIKLSNIQPVKVTLKELLNFGDFDKIINPDWLFDYVITDEYRVDYLSKKIYDDESYWWAILLVNKIDNPLDLPMEPEKMNEFAISIFNNGNNDYGYASLDIVYQLLDEWNNKKRNIKVVGKSNILDFKRAIKKVMEK